MTGALYAFLLLVAVYILIFSGLAFSNKVFLPGILDEFYTRTNFLARVFVMSFVFAFPANLLIAQSFNVVSASVAGPVMLAVILLISVANAMILDKVQITLPLIVAVSGALFFCCLTAWILEAQRTS